MAGPIISLAQERASRAAYRVEHQLYAVENETIAQIKAELETARASTIATLASASKDWQIAQAQALLVEIERQLKAWAAVSSNIIAGRLGDVTDLGVEQVMASLKAGGVGFSLGAGPMISRDFVAVAYQTLPYLISNVSDEAIYRVGSIMRQSVLAQTSPLDAMKAIGTISGKGPFASAFLRGETIVRTEYGRIAQTANYTTLTEIAKDQPTLQRQWSAVMDIRTRPDHAAANGEIRPIDKPYSIGGYDAMYPHDPNLPARESVDCRCISIPYDKGWATDNLAGKAEAPAPPKSTAPLDNAFSQRVRDLNRSWLDTHDGAFWSKASGVLQDVLDKSRVRVRVPGTILPQILADGRLKSQFEAGNNGRAGTEGAMFGYPEGLAPKARPIYGYLSLNGAEPSRFVRSYGNVVIELKPGVASRATVTSRDSFVLDSVARFTEQNRHPGIDRFGNPLPLRKAPASSQAMYDRVAAPTQMTQADAQAFWSPNSAPRDMLDSVAVGEQVSAPQSMSPMKRSIPTEGYWEAQVHDGVTLADIDRVLFTSKPSSSLISQLDAAGVEWEVGQ